MHGFELIQRLCNLGRPHFSGAVLKGQIEQHSNCHCGWILLGNWPTTSDRFEFGDYSQDWIGNEPCGSRARESARAVVACCKTNTILVWRICVSRCGSKLRMCAESIFKYNKALPEHNAKALPA